MTRAREFSQNLSSANGGGSSNITLGSILPFLTTSNVKQTGSNLYFTFSNVFANINLASINDLFDVQTKYLGVGNALITPQENQALVWNGNVWTAANVRTEANLAFNSTNDLREGGLNLYYTNNRARTALTAADPTIIIDWAAGTVRANISAISNAGANTTDGLPEGFANKYYTNARVLAYLSQVVSLNDLKDVKYNSNIVAFPIQTGSTLVYNNANAAFEPGTFVPALSEVANTALTAYYVSYLSNHTTANLTESNVNLYYTDVRVAANVANLSINDLKDVWTPSNTKVRGYVLAWDGSNWYPQDVANVGNVGSSATALFALRAGIANTALVVNQANTSYYANVAGFVVLANIANVASYAAYAEVANTVLNVPLAARASQVSTLSNFTTNDLREGNVNLYFTEDRVIANVYQMRLDTFYDVSTSTANTGQILTYNGTNWVPGDAVTDAQRAAFSERANVANTVLSLSGLTTNNLLEGSNNLYYTTARLATDIQAAIQGKDITLDDLTVGGDLTVQGNLALLNVSNVRTESRLLTLSDSAVSESQAEGSGLYIKGANAYFTYSQTNDGFGVSKNLTINGNLIPAISGQYSIGTASKQWRDLYLGATTLYVGGIAISADPAGGGLQIKDQYGNAAGVSLSNVAATEYVSVNRVYSNVFPLVQFNSYIGGNVQQFTRTTSGNLYLGIMKSGDRNKFAGMRVVETYDNGPDLRSDLLFYNDFENVANSTARLALLGTGNVVFTTNVVSVNNIPVLDNRGHFVGNTYMGTRDVDITHGGTGANTAPNARRNLFGDITSGLLVKYGTANTIGPVALVAGTGVTIENGDAQNGSPTIIIGQPVATTDSVQFRNLTLSGNLYILGNIAAVYSNTLVVNDPMIQVGYGNPADNFDLGFIGHYKTDVQRNAGFFRDHIDQTFKAFDNLTYDSGLNDIDTSNVTFRLANIAAQTFIGNVIGSVSTLNNHTTAALREGANNLYYTNSRVVSAVNPLLTTANVIENTNLYYTNARVNVFIQQFFTTANIRETSANLYFTNARVLAALAGGDLILGNLTVTGRLSQESVNANTFSSNVITGGSINITGNAAFSSIVSNVITGNTLVISGNATIGTGTGGTLSGLSYLYATNIIANVLFANTLAPTRITGNLVVDNKIFANGLVLQNIDVTDTVISGNITGGGGSTFNTVTANSITTGILNVTSNIITLLSAVSGASTSNASISVNRGTNADVALRWEEEIDRWQFTNDGNVYYNIPIPAEYDNVIYSISAETSNVQYSANLKLTGTKSNGNVLIQDQLVFKGTGLVRISKGDSDTIIVDAGIAPVTATPVAQTPVEVTRFRTSLYRTAEFIYTVNVVSYLNPSYANLYNAGKILMLHDNSEVQFTQYAMLLSGVGLELATFSANINNGNVILYATGTDSNQVTVRLSGTTYTEI